MEDGGKIAKEEGGGIKVTSITEVEAE